MSSMGVSVEKQGAVRLLRLDNPARKNALTSQIYEALITELKAADEDDSVRALVFTGSSKVFCSGNDLDDFLENPIRDSEHPVYRFMQQFNRLQKPVVAAVEGHGVGIGCTLLMHCDLVVAGESSWLQMPFVHLGICPEFASTWILPQLAGRQKASELLLLGERLEAQAAASAGLINRVVADGEALASALAYAERLASAPPKAMQAAKKLMRQSEQTAIDGAMSRELDQLVTALQGEEFAAAVNAFKARKTAKESNAGAS